MRTFSIHTVTILLTAILIFGCGKDPSPADSDIQDDGDTRGGDAADGDVADGDEQHDARTPQGLCASFPSPYSREAPRPNPSSMACIEACPPNDLECVVGCPDGGFLLDCIAPTLGVCSWLECSDVYGDFDCCAYEKCGTSALELSGQATCIVQNCQAELDALTNCSNFFDCNDTAFETCFSPIVQVPQGSQYTECVNRFDFPPDRYEQLPMMDYKPFDECRGHCGGVKAGDYIECLVEHCGDLFGQCFYQEFMFCGYYTTCGNLVDELFCCIDDRCPNGERSCVEANCSIYIDLLFDEIPGSCALVALSACVDFPG